MTDHGGDLHRAPAQHEALWLSPQGGTALADFNLLWSLRIAGPLDPVALRAALGAVVSRHDALRAVFAWHDDDLCWRIRPVGPVELDIAPDDSASHAEAVTAFGLAPHDLGGGPLFRFRLIPLGPEDHLLLCAFHHLVIDGTGWSVFARDLAMALAGLELHEAPSALDLARAQDDWLRSPAGEAARQRAAARLAPLGEGWSLPAPAGDATGVAAHQHDLTADLTTRLRDRAAELGTTPFRLLLSVYAALMARLARRDDVAVLTTLTGREGAAIGTVGFHVTQAVLTAPLTGDTTLRDLSGKMRDGLAQAVRDQRLPLRQALMAAGAPATLRQRAVTDVSFTRRPDPLRLVAGALTLTDRWEELPIQDGALAVQAQDRGDRIQLTWRARQDRLGAPGPLAEQFETLLDQALADPDAPLARLSTLPAGDRALILGPLNATDVDFPDAAPLHRMVVAMVRRQPDAVAIVSGGRVLTYAEVHHAAAHLAHGLRSMGIGRGSFVPLMFHPSAEMLIAELGVMMAGAAFVPLSPDWPPARIAELRARLGTVPMLVAAQAAEGEIAVGGLLDGPPPIDPPETDSHADDPIYCIFTSGSTGTPKGAVNLHRGVVNRLLAMTHAFGPAAEDTVLVTAAGTVDTHVWQFFWPLISGGTVVIPTRSQAISAPDLCRLIDDHAVTVTDFVPSVFADLVPRIEETAAKGFDALRLVLIGGEAMRPGDAARFRRAVPWASLVNSYGPTETSIGTIFHIMTADDAPVPLGRPFANVRAVVMGGDDLAPLETVGELYLGGACLGQGYLNDPEATARAFVPNPFPELGGDRLYRTGDLARMRRDGVIDYLGRADHQIKLRALRIEPGEVETALNRQPGIHAALVRAEGDRLVALLHLRPGAEVSPRRLRDALLQALPVHMVPAEYRTVPALPLAAGGKLDRRAAQALAGTPLDDGLERGDPPGTETEIQLSAAWTRLMGVDFLGRDDDLFRDHGIDSLMAMKLVLVAEEIAGQEIGLSALFHAPTLARFAVRLEAMRGEGSTGPTLLDRQRDHLRTWTGAQLRPGGFLYAKLGPGRGHPLFWCCQGHAELEVLARDLCPHRPVVGMRSGHLITDYAPAALDHLAATYAAEMVEMQPEGPFHLGGNCQAARVIRAVARHLRGLGRDVAQMVLLEETEFTGSTERTALLFGEDSHLNPFRDGTDLMPALAAAYGRDLTVAFVPGAHGHLFTPDLTRTVQAILTRADPPQSALLWLEQGNAGR